MKHTDSRQNKLQRFGFRRFRDKSIQILKDAVNSGPDRKERKIRSIKKVSVSNG